MNRINHRKADQFVRVFPVPGMNHCMGGPATAWVENGPPAASMAAAAGKDIPWSGRSRPLCPYPAVARYVGGDLDREKSFRCSYAESVPATKAAI